jgi:16S rRNA (guanine1207-N2)-methyltransferase
MKDAGVPSRLSNPCGAALIHTTIGNLALQFETAEQLFSPRNIDAGTLAMLSRATFAPDDKVLDLGCGYGPVGTYVAKVVDPSNVWLVDNDPVAVEYARRNLKLNGVDRATVVLSDGFLSLTETAFTKILCNQPYHSDFSVPKHMIEKGFNRLAINGTMWMVTKRQDWYRNKLRSIFGSVRVHSRDGYFVFEAVKKSFTYASRKTT